jgi:hypothetical protein
LQGPGRRRSSVVEQLIRNQQAVGSSPTAGSNVCPHLQKPRERSAPKIVRVLCGFSAPASLPRCGRKPDRCVRVKRGRRGRRPSFEDRLLAVERGKDPCPCVRGTHLAHPDGAHGRHIFHHGVTISIAPGAGRAREAGYFDADTTSFVPECQYRERPEPDFMQNAPMTACSNRCR